jgi:phosphosulfolactate phosphohydrolase-like enzyme
MIHRNALLNLRRELEKGARVYIETTNGSVVVSDVVGVQDESHVVVLSNNTTVMVPLDHISSVRVIPLTSDAGTEDLVE